MTTYHDGMRAMQDRFDTRRLADRLEQVTYHQTFWDGDRTFIESAVMFFLATVDADGHPDVSYKGGRPGFVRCLDRRTIAFPSYDGNGMFRSLGNIVVNDRVALLFVNFEKPDRLRVHELYQASFAGHFDFQPRAYETWLHDIDAEGQFLRTRAQITPSAMPDLLVGADFNVRYEKEEATAATLEPSSTVKVLASAPGPGPNQP